MVISTTQDQQDRNKNNNKKAWTVEWEAQTSIWQHSTSTFEDFFGCTALEMPVLSRKMTEQIDWQEGSRHKWLASWKIWSVEELNLDTICRHKAKDITPSISWKRVVWERSTRWSSLWGWERATVYQINIGTVFKVTGGKLFRDAMGHTWAFPDAPWTELICL